MVSSVQEISAPTVRISLDNLLHNLRQIRKPLTPSTGVIAVVKDRAYGCGAAMVARTLEAEGDVGFFAVNTPGEAFSLRDAGVGGGILVLGKAGEDQLRRGASLRITFSCNDADDLALWERATFPIEFHCHIDTGMTRLGLLPSEVPELIAALRSCGHLHVSGIYTHMASADVPGTPTVERQYATFIAARSELEKNGISPKFIHVANSATVLRFPSLGCTHVRPGIALYGCKPDPEQDFTADLRPVMSLVAPVVSMRIVGPETPVSYGGHYVTTRATRIATIGAGYAHGVPRYLSNRGHVIIGGTRYAIAGNVTMDYIMADVGPDSPIRIGDEAVIIGKQGAAIITPDDVAAAGSTIGYEVMCNMEASVDRVYTLHGKPTGTASTVDSIPAGGDTRC